MSEIILKTNEPGKTASILFEALETEGRRLQYSLSLAKKPMTANDGWITTTFCYH